MGVFRYSSSLGAIPAIFSKSSVFSSCKTSTASSTVIMPTSLSSLSTTGSDIMSYLENSFATSSLSSSVCAWITFVFIMSPTLAFGSASSSSLMVTTPSSCFSPDIT